MTMLYPNLSDKQVYLLHFQSKPFYELRFCNRLRPHEVQKYD